MTSHHRPPLTIPQGNFAAYIFDCDGTLVDSMPLHLHAWRAALEMHGFPPDRFTWKLHVECAGMPGEAIVRKLNADFGGDLPPDRVEEDRVSWYMKHHIAVRGIEPVIQIARAAHGRIPLAVASGSDVSIVRESLTIVGIHDLFPTIVTPVDVARGKPAPDMFLLAAERMGVAPQDCLVFEDGLLGIEAAKAAGMQYVFVPVELSAGM